MKKYGQNGDDFYCLEANFQTPQIQGFPIHFAKFREIRREIRRKIRREIRRDFVGSYLGTTARVNIGLGGRGCVHGQFFF